MRANRARQPGCRESTVRELGQLTVEEALRLRFLYAEKEPIKFERAATSASHPAIAFRMATRTIRKRRCTSSCAGAGG